MNFYDKCIINIKAGNGGNGIVAWRREAKDQMGGPAGGNGGNGGDIILVGDHNKGSLMDIFSFKKIEAKSGENGQNKLCHGKNGEDIIVQLPLGTEVIDFKTNEKIIDIVKHNQKYVICHGGKGGKGNAYFKSSFNKIPTLYEHGDIGEELKILFNLKYIADIGIIGLPNAGKSTFINQISNAHSKTGNYQFTTIKPVLGVVEKKKNKVVFADIPGLIENAHTGLGLGIEFLKHIERCHFLIHMISCDENDNGLDVIQSIKIINNELEKFNKELVEKKIYYVLNKIDLVEDYQKIFLKLKKQLKDKKIYLISAKNNLGIDELLKDIFEDYVKYKLELKKLESKDEDNIVISLKPKVEDKLNIEKIDDNYWRVSSKKIEYWFNRIPLNTADNNVRFTQKIDIDFIEKQLIKKGAQRDDTFSVCGIEYIVDR